MEDLDGAAGGPPREVVDHQDESSTQDATANSLPSMADDSECTQTREQQNSPAMGSSSLAESPEDPRCAEESPEDACNVEASQAPPAFFPGEPEQTSLAPESPHLEESLEEVHRKLHPAEEQHPSEDSTREANSCSVCGEASYGAAGACCGSASLCLNHTASCGSGESVNIDPMPSIDCSNASVSLQQAASSSSTATGGPTVQEESSFGQAHSECFCKCDSKKKVAEIAGWANADSLEKTASPDEAVVLGVEQLPLPYDGPDDSGMDREADDFNIRFSAGDTERNTAFNQAQSIRSQATLASVLSKRSSAQSQITSSTMPSKSLRLSIEPTFIRCCPLTTVMWHCGRHFKAGVQEFGSSELFRLSRQVLYIDDFISHSWRDGRWSKFMAVCLLYNGSAAFVASLIVCGLVFAVQLTLPLPVFWGSYKKVVGGQEYDIAEGCLAFLGAPMIYVWFLHSWISIRSTSLRRPVPGVFLDRLCIHQTDEALKCKGILSIGGILKHSQRMVVLWSPEYFFRLWCMFEVAVWCHLDRMDKLVFVPLSKAVLVVVCASGVWMSCVVILLLHRSGGWLDSRIFYALMGGALLSCSPFAMHYLRGLMRDLVALRRQLGNVSVTAADCFCCSHNHVHPDTGQDMQCDRELVMNTVQELFPGTDAHDCAKKFDSKVRKDFAKRIIQSIGGPDAMPMRWCLLIVAPVIWRSADVISARDLPAPVMLRLLFTQSTYVLESLIVVRVCFFLCGYLYYRRAFFVVDALVSCMGAWGCLLLGGCLFLKTYRASMLEALWPMFVNIFISSLLNLAIFWSEFPPAPKRKRHTRTVAMERQMQRSSTMSSRSGSVRSSRGSKRHVQDETHLRYSAPEIIVKEPTTGEEKEKLKKQVTREKFNSNKSNKSLKSTKSKRSGYTERSHTHEKIEQDPGRVVTSWQMAKAAEDQRQPESNIPIVMPSWARRISVGSNASAPGSCTANEYYGDCEPGNDENYANLSGVMPNSWKTAASVGTCPISIGTESDCLSSTDSIGSVITSWQHAKDRDKRCDDSRKEQQQKQKPRPNKNSSKFKTNPF